MTVKHESLLALFYNVLHVQLVSNSTSMSTSLILVIRMKLAHTQTEAYKKQRLLSCTGWSGGEGNNEALSKWSGYQIAIMKQESCFFFSAHVSKARCMVPGCAIDSPCLRLFERHIDLGRGYSS